jgi:hypothetical protein
MKFNIIIYIMICHLWIAAPLHATTPKHQLAIGLNNLNLTYTEPSAMKETGTLLGLNGTHTISWPNNVSIATQLHYYNGNITYDGELMDNTPKKIKNISNTIFVAEVHIQKEFRHLSTSLTPYIGLGYRYWLDELGTDPSGYDRKTTYLYIPIGTTLHYPVTETLSLNILSQYNLFIEGKNTSDYSKFTWTNDNLNVTQSTGYGYLLDCNATLKLSQQNRLSANIQYHYWDIANSSVDYLQTTEGPKKYKEPKNKTKELRLGIQYNHLLN